MFVFVAVLKLLMPWSDARDWYQGYDVDHSSFTDVMKITFYKPSRTISLKFGTTLMDLGVWECPVIPSEEASFTSETN